MSDRLPSEFCPFCDSERPALRWGIDAVSALERQYRCVECGRTWGVTGRQENLFDLESTELGLG